MDKDYSHLLKELVRCIATTTWTANGRKEATGIVAGIKFNKGITIIDFVTGKELVCLNKEVADDGRYTWLKEKTYEQEFERVVKAIEDGIYHSDGSFGTPSVCAFSN